jgi:hypothetical protein
MSEGKVERDTTGRTLDRRLPLSAALVLLVALAASGFLDAGAIGSNDRVFGRALLTLGAARALDAAISLAQGTEIAMQPAGMGLTISAGELLDPINDLLEQFSSLMLVATTSLGLQGLLLRASGWWVLTGLLSAAIVLRLVLLWSPESVPTRWRGPSQRALVLLLVLRFALPGYALVSGLIFDRFLEPSSSAAVTVLEETTGDVREMERLESATEPPEDRSWTERVSSWFASTVETLDVEGRIEAFRDRVAVVAEQVVTLLVIFSLQTILLPLAFLWAVPRLVGAAFDRLR